MADSNSTSSGIGFSGLLTVAFVVLKLCNVIAWSWLWVLSPIWIPIGIALIGLIIYSLFAYKKSVDTKKRLAAGVNEHAWRHAKPEQKSKWQQRMEEMQAKRNS